MQNMRAEGSAMHGLCLHVNGVADLSLALDLVD